MGMRDMRILLDNLPANGYPPGSTITGRVIISADDRINIRSMNLKVHGEASVSFTGMVTRRRRRFIRLRNSNTSTNFDEIETSTEIERFTAHEEYFKTTYQILGETCIQPGEQEFLFTVVLPTSLPSTFSGQHGYIRYSLKIKLDKAWNFDQIAKVEFKVAAPKDLNNLQFSTVADHTFRNLSDSLVYRGMKHFNCLCCKSGPVSLAVQLSKSGLVPGETLQLNIELDNTTKININSVNIILRQETIWTARSPRLKSKTTNETLLLIHGEGVPKLNSNSWRQSVIIPPIPYINIDSCSIIKLQHFIVVEAVPEGVHSNLTVLAPLVIGTIPIRTPERMYDPPYNPQQPDIGFSLPQPSAPVDYRFDLAEPPPPYPMNTAPYPTNEPLKKF